MKALLRKLWLIDSHVRGFIALSRFCFYRVPLVGRFLSYVVDRLLLLSYGLDGTAHTVAVRYLTISHPNGVLLGGNGLVSQGRVAIMAGAKLVGRSPSDPEYLARHKTKDNFRFGDNVVIGAGSVVIGPIDICDNVIIGSMSLVNKSISEPGLYVGVPARKIRDEVSDEWVSQA
ncbi:MAG: hypothetical protein ABS76_26850 [Pelagibacterium sp. SCN 64-44]|nr:MAG: hypothetical protein ABS76_26850 [Pelagibacterium sp. SCN 64-44]